MEAHGKKENQEMHAALMKLPLPFYWDGLCWFLTKCCIKKFTCSILGCTDNAEDKNGSAI